MLKGKESRKRFRAHKLVTKKIERSMAKATQSQKRGEQIGEETIYKNKGITKN